jgi:hypothetical protein
MAAAASGAVVVGGTESFTNGVNGGADWGVGGSDGWQVNLWKNQGLTNDNNSHMEFFGSTGQLFSTGFGTNSKGQLVGTSHTGAADTGTLVVQHMAGWTGANGTTVPDPAWTSNQIKHITFNSVAGVTYDLSGYVNTVFGQRDTFPWDGKHPRVVNHNNPTMSSQFANVQIGLKLGAADATDLDTNYTQVNNLVDNMLGGNPNPNAWVQTPHVTLVGDGGPMTVILKVQMCDISTGAKDADNNAWDLDVRFDDITITPEPATLSLLGLGLAFILRRR